MPDYIERDAVAAAVIAEKWAIGSGDGAMAMQIVLSAPAADVAPVVHGRWILTEDGDWRCSNCKNDVSICDCGKDKTRHKPYCPNCGAKMDGERSEDDGSQT